MNTWQQMYYYKDADGQYYVARVPLAECIRMEAVQCNTQR